MPSLQPRGLVPKPQTPNPKPQTPNPKPQTPQNLNSSNSFPAWCECEHRNAALNIPEPSGPRMPAAFDANASVSNIAFPDEDELLGRRDFWGARGSFVWRIDECKAKGPKGQEPKDLAEGFAFQLSRRVLEPTTVEEFNILRSDEILALRQRILCKDSSDIRVALLDHSTNPQCHAKPKRCLVRKRTFSNAPSIHEKPCA